MIMTVDAINGLMKFEPDPYGGYAVEYINQFLYKLRSHWVRAFNPMATHRISFANAFNL